MYAQKRGLDRNLRSGNHIHDQPQGVVVKLACLATFRVTENIRYDF